MAPLSQYGSSKNARTHDQARKVVCCVCSRKVTQTKNRSGTIQAISEKFENLVRKFVFKDYSIQNEMYPTALCITCRLALTAMNKDEDNPKRKLPPLLDYKNFRPPTPNTRSSGDQPCKCTVCTISRMDCCEYTPYAKKHSNPVGGIKKTPASPVKRTIHFCSRCLSVIGKGMSHTCNKSSRNNNLCGLLENTSPKTRSILTAINLKSIALESNVSLRGGTVELKTRSSKVLPVQIGTAKVKPRRRKFSLEDLLRLQATLNISDRAIL